MKKTILAGAIAAMMLASAATSAVTCAQDNNAKVVTVISAAKASGKNSVVKLSRLSDCTAVYPQSVQSNGGAYVAELKKNRVIKGRLQMVSGETLYIPSGKTLTLNSEFSMFGGTVFVEKGATLILNGALYINESASVICDGTIKLNSRGSIHVGDGGILYSSPESTVKLNSSAFMYSSDYATNVLLGAVNKNGGLSTDTKRTFTPAIVSAVRTTTDIGCDVITTETVKPTDAEKVLSVKWYTLAEIPAGGTSKLLNVLFDNGSSIKFSFMGDRLFGIQGTSIRNIWSLSEDRLTGYDMLGNADEDQTDTQFTGGQLDAAVSESCNVVRAKLKSVEEKPSTVNYIFTVTDQLKGETAKKICVKLERSSDGADKKEFTVGGEYLLFLNPVDYVFTDLYYTLTYSVSAEISGGKLTAVIYYGRRYTPAQEISTVDKVCGRISETADMDSGTPQGGGYLHSDGVSEIVKYSPYIVKVKITGEGKTLGLSDDACVYAVELEESYKLAPETPMNLVLQKDRVKVGEEYIVCLLTYPYVSRELKYYQESSKNSVFKPGDPALKAAMEDLYL